MSFSQRCKKEILKREPISRMGELLAIIHFIGSIRINREVIISSSKLIPMPTPDIYII